MQSQTIIIGVPLRSKGGAFIGAVNGALDLSYFQNLVDSLEIGPKGLISVRRSDTTKLLLRHPMISDKLNEASLSLATSRVSNGETYGIEDFVSKVDQVRRITAFQRVPGFPIAVYVGLSHDDFLYQWKIETALSIVFTVIFETLLVLLFLRQTQTQRNLELAKTEIRRKADLYLARSIIDQAIVRLPDTEELCALVCRCAVEFGGMSMAFICKHDERSKVLYSVARHGHELDYVDQIRVTSDGSQPEGRGPTGTAFRENRTVVVNDFQQDSMTAPWHERGKAHGWNSSASFPILRNGKPYAVLSVYHDLPNAFDDETEMKLMEMAHSISFAIENYDREVKRKHAESSLRTAGLVYEKSSEAMAVTTPDGVILAVNPAFSEMTGYSKDEAVGQPARILQSGRHDKFFYAAMWEELNSTGHWKGEIWNKRKNGEIYPELLTINTVYEEDGSVSQRVALFSDISEEKKTQEVIWQHANFDALTKLPNRRMFLERLEQEIKTSRRTALPMALLFIDLDRFKEVNDTLGHEQGDILLQEAAKRLLSCVRETDVVGRLGGDEFTVLLSGIEDPSSVDRVAEMILQKIAAPYQLGPTVAYVSASIGISLYPEEAVDVSNLLKNADQAMYASKKLGRNRFNYFKPAMQDAALLRVGIANDLRTAIADGQFKLFYQPIVSLSTGGIHKAEALIRWFHPTKGMINPADFIPIAEETGLITTIGEWVFQEAASQAARWQVFHRPPIQISINKSPVQFSAPKADHSSWISRLNALGLKGDAIAVEITEGLLLDASASINNQLLEFSEAGIQVSIDDFGTGYSSLSYLKKFDIDYLKIDQSFISGLTTGESDKALCEAIIVMAHKLGMKVIAEGIETEDQRDFLQKANCDFGQGYLFSRPVPAEEFERLLMPPLVEY